MWVPNGASQVSEAPRWGVFEVIWPWDGSEPPGPEMKMGNEVPRLGREGYLRHGGVCQTLLIPHSLILLRSVL